MLTALAILPFVTPGIFLAGAAATSIPIIIHLLNKRRFRVLIWAAMDFLLAAQRRNARKLKFQRWLLLALRILAILFLAAAIAQFTLSSTAVGGLLGGSRIVVLVLDDSYSMAYERPGGGSAFERARRLAVEHLAALKSGDKALVIRTSDAASAASAKLTPDPRSLVSLLQGMRVSDAPTDLTTALNTAATVIKADVDISRNRQVLVLTDLSASSIPGESRIRSTDQSAGREQLKKAAERVKELATLRVVDLGVDKQFNLAITDLKPVRPIVVAGMMADLSCTVFNGTDLPQIDVPLTLVVDGQPILTQKLGKIEPGKQRTVPLSHIFATPGRHWVEVKLPPDLLPIDDVRRIVVNVQRDIPMLLVDGTPGDRHALGSSTYLWLAYALSSEEKAASAFAARTIPELQLGQIPLNGVQAVALCDTSVPEPATVKRLKEYVEEGGLLLIFPGPRWSAPDAWNRALGDNGAKLLPASIGPAEKIDSRDDIGRGLTFDPAGYTHPVLEKFAEAAKSGMNVGLTTAQTQTYIQLGVPKDGSSDVILRFAAKPGTDAKATGPAAVVAKQVGRGRVVLFATTADTTWTSLPAKPSFVPFMHELAYYLLAGEADRYTLGVGQKINLPVDAGAAGWWTAPRNTRINVLLEKDKDNLQRMRLTTPPLLLSGFYAPEGGKPTVAVNVDAAAEADIRHLSARQIATALTIDAREVIAQPNSLEFARTAATQSSGGGSIGRNLLVVALALFLLETVLARLFSVYK